MVVAVMIMMVVVVIKFVCLCMFMVVAVMMMMVVVVIKIVVAIDFNVLAKQQPPHSPHPRPAPPSCLAPPRLGDELSKTYYRLISPRIFM